MTALTENRDLNRMVDQDIREYEVLTAETIFKGSLVGRHPVLGYVKPFELCDEFVGIAYEQANNSAGSSGDTDGRKLGTVDQQGLVRLFTQGDFTMTLSGVTRANIGAAVYATDDGAIALVGHWDGFVGRIVAVDSTNTAVIRLRIPFEEPKINEGAIKMETDFLGDFTATGTTAGTPHAFGDLRIDSELGLGVAIVTDEGHGAIDMIFDAQAEIAYNSIETPQVFDLVKGISYFVRLHMEAIGDDAAMDVDWGIAAEKSDTIRKNMDDSGLTIHARFHLDGATTAILAEADDATVDVAATDTTAVNVASDGAYKDFHILVRGDSAVPEFYIDGARVLTSTFDTVILLDGIFYGFVNMEKSSNDTVGTLRIDKMRVAGGTVA